MRQSIIAGNWKMNGSKAQMRVLLESLKTFVYSNHPQVVVFPSFPFLAEAECLLKETPIAWGGQNCYFEEAGAFTGEVSVSMLKELGCQYVLIGHSERRTLFGETDEIITKKYQAALAGGLIPMVCVGETLEQREQGLTEHVIRQQLSGILRLENSFQQLQNTVIAYEPVWAIGSGLTASPEMAQEVHSKIRGWIAETNKGVAESVRILYGGSVKPSNAADLFEMPDIDGALVGGASLVANDFLEIMTICNP